MINMFNGNGFEMLLWLNSLFNFSTASDIINDNMGGCINDSYYLLKERFV